MYSGEKNKLREVKKAEDVYRTSTNVREIEYITSLKDSDLREISYFEVRDLKKYSPPDNTKDKDKNRGWEREFLNENLYKEEDFCASVNQNFEGRIPINIKLGKIFFQYQTGGKGSVELVINLIDKDKKQITPIFNLKVGRYQGIEFDCLIPFDISSFNLTMTGVPRAPINDPKAIKIRKASLEVRKLLVKLALNEEVRSEEFRNATADFMEALDNRGVDNLRVSHNPEALPQRFSLTRLVWALFTNDQEPNLNQEVKAIAEKIAERYYAELSLTENDLVTVLNEHGYGKNNELNKEILNDIVNSYVDKDRYTLKMLIPLEISERLEEIVRKVNAVERPSAPPQDEVEDQQTPLLSDTKSNQAANNAANLSTSSVMSKKKIAGIVLGSSAVGILAGAAIGAALGWKAAATISPFLALTFVIPLVGPVIAAGGIAGAMIAGVILGAVVGAIAGAVIARTKYQNNKSEALLFRDYSAGGDSTNQQRRNPALTRSLG